MKKHYDFSKVKSFIEQHRSIIQNVTLGFHEDWFWTAQEIFSEGEFKRELPERKASEIDAEFFEKRKAGLRMFLDEKDPETGLSLSNPEFTKYTSQGVGGMFGSVWATPVMRVEYFDGAEEFIECSEGTFSVEDVTERIEQEMFLKSTLGSLSGPVQDSIKEITRSL